MSEKDYAELKAENERLKAEFEIESLTDNTTGETIYRSRLVNNLQEVSASFANLSEAFRNKANEYKSCLQEIKAIAKKLMADNLCNNCDGIGLDANCQDISCPYYQMDRILDLITKAEEE